MVGPLIRAAACVVAALFALEPAAFDVEGHRGARGLAPENTLAAFRRALEAEVAAFATAVGAANYTIA